MHPQIPREKIEGILLGTAVGDALGLPMEGMKPASINLLGWTKSWKHRFVFGHGMWSDDTEHSIMLAQSLLASGGDEDTFLKCFAWELRWWLFGLPAGVGMATAKAMIKLWLGISPRHSGVFSAGNGTAMRTAIIAAYSPHNKNQRSRFVKAHTRMTHSDPKAVIASLSVTELTHHLLQANTPPTKETVLNLLDIPESDPEWKSIISHMKTSWEQGLPLTELLSSIGGDPKKGISGYAYHTVPAVIHLGVFHQWDFEKTITGIITAGGDTDTTAAIAGALCGAYGGRSSIPDHWIHKIKELPTNVNDFTELAQAIQDHTPLRIRPRWSPLLFLRNILFLLIVLTHGFSRLIPVSIRKHLIS